MIWDELTGQADAIATVRGAAETGAGMTHAWLITGPPGSGRSTLAYAFAAALLAGEGDAEAAMQQVQARTHPDLSVVSTEGVLITIKQVRDLVAFSQYSPAVSRYRVVVIEDADRMIERTSNVLLKALEEPPPRTVWILCAPSEADLLPTIRSRVRSVRLTTPSVADVAALLQRRDGVDAALAERAAREAQSHIGMAHRLATSAEARERRDRTVALALGLRSTSAAVLGAAELVELAGADARAFTEERDAAERAELLHSMGVEEGGTVPAQMRSTVKQLEEDQKRRATRSLRDGLDRILVDLLSVYRDVLLLQLGAGSELVNGGHSAQLERAARVATAAETLTTLDALAEARERLPANVAPALVMEAAMISAIRRRDPAGG